MRRSLLVRSRAHTRLGARPGRYPLPRAELRAERLRRRGRVVGRGTQIPGSAPASSRFERGARGNIFDLAFADLGVQCGREHQLAELVESVSYAPASNLTYRRRRAFPWSTDTQSQSRDNLRRAARLADTQRYRRSRSDTVAFPIVLTDRWGPGFSKPHERAFLEVQVTLGCAASECVYVGSNPAKDFTAPRALSWQTLSSAAGGVALGCCYAARSSYL